MAIAKLFLLGRGIDVRPQRERLVPQFLARQFRAKCIHSYHILTRESFSKYFPSAILSPTHTVVLLRSWLQKWTRKIWKAFLSLSYWRKGKGGLDSGHEAENWAPRGISVHAVNISRSIVAIIARIYKLSGSHSWRSQVKSKTNANDIREQCSVLNENYLAVQLMFVNRTTGYIQNRITRVESGDENEEGDSTTNVGLIMLTAMQIANWREL